MDIVRCAKVLGCIVLVLAMPCAFAQEGDLEGVWVDGGGEAWIGLSPSDSAAQAIAAFDRATDDPAMRCVYPGLLRTMDSPAPMEIVQQNHQILILYEAFHVVRRIYLIERPNVRPDRLPLSRLGYSVGRWEDGELVVETTRLSRTFLDDDGFPFGGNADTRVIERYRRVGDRLELEATVEDPLTLRSTATWHASWTHAPDTLVLEYACDPAHETGWRFPEDR